MASLGFAEALEIFHTMTREPTGEEFMPGVREGREEITRPDLAPSHSILGGIVAGEIVALCSV